jgi:Skp family chaperone for outer membrane proteins
MVRGKYTSGKDSSMRYILALMLLLAPLSAQAANIAVVNIPAILKDAKAANAVRDQLKLKQKSFQEELDRKEAELRKEDQELAKQRSVLSQEAFEAKYREFRQKAGTAQQEVRAKRVKLDKGFAEAMETIQKKVTDIVTQISKEKGYDLAMSKAQVFYAGADQDITAEVLKRLDQQMPNLNVSFN